MRNVPSLVLLCLILDAMMMVVPAQGQAIQDSALFLLLIPTVVQALHVEYHKPRSYEKGDRIPLLFNKLTSPRALVSMDLDQLPVCGGSGDVSRRPATLDDASGRWQRAIDSWHGDFWQSAETAQLPYQINMLQDVYCQPLCWMEMSQPQSPQQDIDNKIWLESIRRDMHWNLKLDDLPVAYKQENEFEEATRYWGGIPLGYQKGSSLSSTILWEDDDYDYDDDYEDDELDSTPGGRRQAWSNRKTMILDGSEGYDDLETGNSQDRSVLNNTSINGNSQIAESRSETAATSVLSSVDDPIYIYNHWNIEIMYSPVPASSSYQVIRVMIEPFSIRHEFQVNQKDDITILNSTMDSCRPTEDDGTILKHASYTNSWDWDPQTLFPTSTSTTTGSNGIGASVQGHDRILFTYDVIWKPVDFSSNNNNIPPPKRWTVFLTMDNAIPLSFQLAGLVLAVTLNIVIFGLLIVWIMRDLSYKPIYYDLEEKYHGTDFLEEHKTEKDCSSVEPAGNPNHPQTTTSSDSTAGITRTTEEMNLWPLSSRIFLPPRQVPWLLCILCGTGVHLITVAFLFIVLFRLGIINQSIGSGMITPGVVLYTVTSPLAGLVAGRLSVILHFPWWIRTLWIVLGTSLWYPILGILVIHLVYDVFPDPALAPPYQALSNGSPIIMIWLWVVIPCVVAGGWLGHRLGPLADFPVSSSEQGYQELHLQVNEPTSRTTRTDDIYDPYGCHQYKNEPDFVLTDDREEVDGTGSFYYHNLCGWMYRYRKCWWNSNNNKWRTLTVFFLAGIPPILCCFVAFSYGIAGPVFMNYYSSTKLISIAPFVLSLSCAAGLSALLFYRQIRSYNYAWWWVSFLSGASCGFYVFILALSWLFFNISNGFVQARTFAAFFFWFAHLSVGVACMGGAAGIGACIVLSQFFYVYTTLDEMNADYEGPNPGISNNISCRSSSLQASPACRESKSHNGTTSMGYARNRSRLWRFGCPGDARREEEGGYFPTSAASVGSESQQSILTNRKLTRVPEETDEDIRSRNSDSVEANIGHDAVARTNDHNNAVSSSSVTHGPNSDLSFRLPPPRRRESRKRVSQLAAHHGAKNTHTIESVSPRSTVDYDRSDKEDENCRVKPFIPRRLPVRVPKISQMSNNIVGLAETDVDVPTIQQLQSSSSTANRSLSFAEQSEDTGSTDLVVFMDNEEDDDDSPLGEKQVRGTRNDKNIKYQYHPAEVSSSESNGMSQSLPVQPFYKAAIPRRGPLPPPPTMPPPPPPPRMHHFPMKQQQQLPEQIMVKPGSKTNLGTHQHGHVDSERMIESARSPPNFPTGIEDNSDFNFPQPTTNEGSFGVFESMNDFTVQMETQMKRIIPSTEQQTRWIQSWLNKNESADATNNRRSNKRTPEDFSIQGRRVPGRQDAEESGRTKIPRHPFECGLEEDENMSPIF